MTTYTTGQGRTTKDPETGNVPVPVMPRFVLNLHKDNELWSDCGGQVASGDLFGTDFWCVYCGKKWNETKEASK